MDIKDRLELLKRERRARSRPHTVEDAWRKIDRESELSVKDKLQKLINLTGQNPARNKARSPASPEFLESVRGEPVQIIENSYGLMTSYGRTPIGLGLEIRGDVLSFLSRSGEFEDLDLSTALFFDLETTGLAGGAGTVAFLVGLGFYRNDRFNLVQYFLADRSEEQKMVEDLARFFEEMDFRSIVTYNGKYFDLPLLETRFVLNRTPLRLSSLPHLDFLFAARSLWKHKYESCRLFHLAREIVQADRAEDIPSEEIPGRYFEYMRTGNRSLIEPVIYHNQEDILSLLGLVISGAMLLSKKGEEFFDEALDALDLYGLGKIYETAGEVEKSVQFFEQAIRGELTEAVAIKAWKRLSAHFKKNRLWDKAIPMWQEMAGLNQLYSFRELAMYYEHKEKDYLQAKRAAEEGLALAQDLDSNLARDFGHRLERLNHKLGRPGKNGRTPA
ncbi:MAG: ribonuclease H-like domain-containing protein [Candidatus Aminicenantes bacterium]|nr:ribonuclease H-like domain-containing protein [Candidatus Aminicenantes bacterium]